MAVTDRRLPAGWRKCFVADVYIETPNMAELISDRGQYHDQPWVVLSLADHKLKLNEKYVSDAEVALHPLTRLGCTDYRRTVVFEGAAGRVAVLSIVDPSTRQ